MKKARNIKAVQVIYRKKAKRKSTTEEPYAPPSGIRNGPVSGYDYLKGMKEEIFLRAFE